MREELRNCAKYSFHPFGYLHIRVNSCTGRSLQSPFLSSLKLILGNSFQVSVIRIEYARYSCEYRIRKASQEYFKTLPSLIFLFLSLNSTVQGVWMCIPQSAVFPSWNLTTLRVFVCFIISIKKRSISRILLNLTILLRRLSQLFSLWYDRILNFDRLHGLPQS